MANHYRALEQAGLVGLLQEWIEDASQLQVTHAKSFAQNLKAIFNALVDKQLGTLPVKKQAKTPQKTRPPSAQPRQATPTTSSILRSAVSHSAKKLSSFNSRVLSRTGSRSSRALVLPTEDLLDISDFCYISGASTFTKTKRNTLPVHDPSPGPAAYDPSVELAKQRSPQIVVPTGGTRIEFANYNSPGPAAYRPRRHFLAKH